MDDTRLLATLLGPIDSNATPDRVVFHLEDAINTAPFHIKMWYNLPDDIAYKTDPNLRISQGVDDIVYLGYICLAVLFFTNQFADNDPFIREHRQMYLTGYAKGVADFEKYFSQIGLLGVQSIEERRAGLFSQFQELRARYAKRIAFTASPHLGEMGKASGWMFAIAAKLRDIDILLPPNSQMTAHTSTLADFIVRDKAQIMHFIDSELSACAGKQGKLVALIIVVLKQEGYLVDITGKLLAIHNAFRETYPGKVGSPQGIIDYVNSVTKDQYDGSKQLKKEDVAEMANKLKKSVG